MPFALQKILSISWGPIYQLLILVHVLVVFCSESVNRSDTSPVSMCSKIFPTFYFIRFSVSSFRLRSLVHLALSFVQGDTYLHFSSCRHTVWSALFVEDAVFFAIILSHSSKIICPQIYELTPGSHECFSDNTI